MPGPIIRTYKGGSVIYMEKDRAEDIYVLQSGRVVLTYMSPDGKAEIKEDVKIGEFFGVKSALGRYPREETAQVVGGASVLVFKMQDFEAFVAKKTHLILKMMKVFSSQLRQIHGKVREHLGQFSEARSPSFELMNVAEVYHKMGNFNYAAYAYKKYLEQYPDGNYASRAKELLKIAQRNSMYPSNIAPLTYEPERKPFVTQSNNSNTQTNIPAITIQESSTSKANKQMQEMFEKANQFFESSKYEEASVIYKSLSEYKEAKSEAENAIIEESLFRYGICLKELRNLDEAYASLSTYVKKYPKGSHAKESIFNLGLISIEKGERDKAIMLFNKVATLPPEDIFSERARASISELKG